jgi:selenocysteine-specific elongation factor
MAIVVGTAGHIDHGKTTLLRVLTGIDADRLPEERRRGMTIDIGYAHMPLADGTIIDFVDVPGHERLIGNMLVGVGEIDAALLVVAADDGPRAQTDEHLALLDAMAIGQGVVAVTKADLAGPRRTAQVVAEMTGRIAATSLAGSPVIAVSSVDLAGIDALRLALERLARGLAVAAPASGGTGSHLAVDRSFRVTGRGAVVTGTLRGRGFAVGTSVRLVPGDRQARIREIQAHGIPVTRAQPGRTALNLAGLEIGELRRGLVVTDDPTIRAGDRWLVSLSSPLPDRSRARLHVGTDAVDVGIGRSGRDAIDLDDGRSAAILRLASPVATAIGDRFVLRRGAGATRIVGGVVLDVHPPRGLSRRRQTPDRVGRLAMAVGVAPQGPEVAAARLDLHGFLADGGDGSRSVADDVVQAIDAMAVEMVDAGPVPLSAVRAAAARTLRRRVTVDRDAAVIVAGSVIDRLVAAGDLTRTGATISRPGQAGAASPDAVAPQLAAAMDRLERILDVAAPPALAEAARDADCPTEGILLLERSGRIVVLDPGLAYGAATYQRLTDTAVELASVRPLTPAALRDATGTSRRYVLALLTELDRRGILRRTTDGHVPGARVATVTRSRIDR